VTYLAVCTIYRDHARDLAEWIEFHRLIGAERFFLYDNGSVDDHRDVLAPYLADGTAVVHDWPHRPGMRIAFDHCLQHHREDARWIAFIDIDEFLFSPTGRPVSDLLTEYEDAPGVGVNRFNFGTSGHRTRPAGLVIENFVRRANRRHNAVKSIVDPRRTSHSWGGHNFAYLDGFAVDEQHRVLDQPTPKGGAASVGAFTPTFTLKILRINHYSTKSEEELRAKHALPRPDTGEMRPDLLSDPERYRQYIDTFNAFEDEDILIYLDRLRKALAERDGTDLGPAPAVRS
jgi:hypothetical protein